MSHQIKSKDNFDLVCCMHLITVHNLINRRNFYFETDDAEDPAYVPVYWVGKWVDYSDKYGFGYQLSDNSVGVLFNDLTRVILFQDGE